MIMLLPQSDDLQDNILKFNIIFLNLKEIKQALIEWN